MGQSYRKGRRDLKNSSSTDQAGVAIVLQIDARKLAAEGITHVYVNWLEILRYRAPGSYGYTDFVTPKRFRQLQKIGVLDEAWHIPEATLPVETRDPGTRDELRRLAPELLTMPPGEAEAFVTFQVFPVAP